MSGSAERFEICLVLFFLFVLRPVDFCGAVLTQENVLVGRFYSWMMPFMS